jgi:hypothetical protein
MLKTQMSLESPSIIIIIVVTSAEMVVDTLTRQCVSTTLVQLPWPTFPAVGDAEWESNLFVTWVSHWW